MRGGSFPPFIMYGQAPDPMSTCSGEEDTYDGGRNSWNAFRRAAATAERRLLAGIQIAASPRAALAALVEVRNKAEVYFLVRENSRALRVPTPAPQPFPLQEFLRRAYARGPYPALWAVEGLGRLFGESQMEHAGGEVSGLLSGGIELPEKSLLMLHAGIGLAFAQWRLQRLDADFSPEDIHEVVRWFSRTCRANSRPGYLGAAWESLGLVVRTFYGRLVHDLDQAIVEAAPELRSWFWHGVGRAVYFLPVNFLPCSTWETLMRAEREAVDDLSHANVTSGIAWGMVMVNLRDPDVLAELVIGPHGAELRGNDAFLQGAAASLVMRRETTPDATFLDPWLDYADRTRDGDEPWLWDELIRGPGREALVHLGPDLKRSDALDELFHYAPLSANG